jgi:manganese-dependent ADP-ribose/CDP-alcohol diphosphatase
LLVHLPVFESLESRSATALYFSFSPIPGIRCFVLDGYDISTIGASSKELGEYADDLVKSKNHNYAAGRIPIPTRQIHFISSTGSDNWFDGIAQENLRYVPFNGGLSAVQLDWLRSGLDACHASGESAILFTHMPLHVEASKEPNLLWNCEEVLRILHSYERGLVLCCVSGHDHDGGYAMDSHGIQHFVPPSPIECDEGEVSYGQLKIFKNKTILLEWVGKLPESRLWPSTPT